MCIRDRSWANFVHSFHLLVFPCFRRVRHSRRRIQLRGVLQRIPRELVSSLALFVSASVTVSYTHLDVYKRQEHISPALRRGPQRTIFVRWGEGTGLSPRGELVGKRYSTNTARSPVGTAQRPSFRRNQELPTQPLIHATTTISLKPTPTQTHLNKKRPK